MCYSENLRTSVINYVIEKKKSMRSASKIFNVHYNTVKDWVKKFKETGELSPKPFPGKQQVKIDLLILKQEVLEHPDRFQYEHAQTFGVGQSAISYSIGLH